MSFFYQWLASTTRCPNDVPSPSRCSARFVSLSPARIKDAPSLQEENGKQGEGKRLDAAATMPDVEPKCCEFFFFF